MAEQQQPSDANNERALLSPPRYSDQLISQNRYLPGEFRPTEHRESYDDELNLRELWRIAMLHKWLIVSLTSLGLITAIFLSLLRTPLYQATASVQIDRRAAAVVQFGPDIGQDLELDDRTGLGTQLELLRSRALAERVIEKLNLNKPVLFSVPAQITTTSNKDEITLNSQSPSWQERLNRIGDKLKDGWRKTRKPVADNEEHFSREVIYEAFRESVHTELVRNTRLIKISVQNPDPHLAARIANTIADEFIDLNLERRQEATSYAKFFLENQLSLTKEKLEQSERVLHKYARDNDILTLDDQTNVNDQTFTEFSTALARAEQERIRAQANYSSVVQQPGTAAAVLASETIGQYKAQRALLAAEYQENASIYKPMFPKMLQLKAQMADIDGKIDAEIASILNSLRNELAAAQQQEASLRQRLTQVREQIVEGQDQGVEYKLLKREVDTNRELYDGLLQQAKEISVSGGVETNNIQMTDSARAPLFPFKPKIKLNGIIGFLVGLFSGFGLAFIVEKLNDSFKLSEDVERILKVPLLGVIPKQKFSQDINIAQIIQRDPRGPIAESYRSVRTALQFLTSDGAPSRLLVSSTIKGEGKSSTAIALAVSFALLGRRTVLVDADLRDPSLHRKLQLGNEHGLSSYISKDSNLKQILQNIGISNFRVITSGPKSASPADLLSSPRFDNLLLALKDREVEHIIFDGPPVLGLADVVILGNRVPDILYVVQANQTRKSHVKEAFRRLHLTGVVPSGVVLTKVTSHNTAYYQYDSGTAFSNLRTVKSEPDLAIGYHESTI